MNLPAFFDIEVSERGERIPDIGCIGSDGSTFHKNQVTAFLQFIRGAEFICGHNILTHDLVHLQKYTGNSQWSVDKAIVTLLLSPLLFPENPYQLLLKDDKLQTEERNNLLNDAIKYGIP